MSNYKIETLCADSKKVLDKFLGLCYNINGMIYKRRKTMQNAIVRLEEIRIQNFKNVIDGELALKNTRKPYEASVLGLYGQNGSGKTALIDALSVLKLVLSGKPIPLQYAEYVNMEADNAALKFTFSITTPQVIYNVEYSFNLRKCRNDNDQNMVNDKDDIRYMSRIYNECVKYSYRNDTEDTSKQTLIDTKTEKAFIPSKKYRLLIGNDPNDETDLIVEKRMASASARSFIFSSGFLKKLNEKCTSEFHKQIIDALVFYGNYELSVITTSNTGRITMGYLPLIFQYEVGDQIHTNSIQISLNSVNCIPENIYDVISRVFDSMNIVLPQIVPGLTVAMKDLGTDISENGANVRKIRLMSVKNGKELPLQYESEGIKKIISVLHLLIQVYNHSSITVAIDELDSGVFEYLLGEIIRIVSENGKGQLIFTSHNLRPLETLDKGFIAFTTTNPSHRYIRMTNIKTNNNLRDFYYRDIILGEQKEEVYAPTNNSEIAFAFREAGYNNGK